VMNKVLLTLLLGVGSAAASGSDLNDEEVLAMLKEMYPQTFKDLQGGYDVQQDRWIYKYESEGNCLDCGFWVIIEDDKDNPAVRIVRDG